MSIKQNLTDIFESSLPEKLADYLDMDINKIKSQVKELSFAEYMELVQALEEYNDTVISQYVQEGDNPYARPKKPVQPSSPKSPTSPASNPLNLDIKGQDGETDTTIASLDTRKNTADVIDKSGRKSTVNIDDLEDEIEGNVNNNADTATLKALKQLAGIKETTTAGGIAAGPAPVMSQKRRLRKKK